MKLKVEIRNSEYEVVVPGYCIAVSLAFDGPQPSTYGVAAASAKAYEHDGWVGDVRRGGSCNFETYTLTPHCNGTHTECIGHLTAERVRIHERLTEAFTPARLISVVPRAAAETEDSYDPGFGESDWVIDRLLLEEAVLRIEGEMSGPGSSVGSKSESSESESSKSDESESLADSESVAEDESDLFAALVIRTLPNDRAKRTRDFMKTPPAFFTLEAMAYIRSLGIRHLLVDLPSVDRLFDEGKLSTHHLFWEISNDGTDQLEGERMFRTITEMVFVPDAVVDGHYLLNLQIAPFLSDAAPSRPILFEMKAL